MTTPSLLTLDEVAQELRISKAHVSKLTRGLVRGTKPLPVVRLGRRVLVRREDVFHWLSQVSSSNVVR
jgi:excisionase family DNA binding protein